jgi:Rrf2 family protein
MLVTRETDYAVRCMLYLAGTSGRVTCVTEISRMTDIPRSFLAKIIQRLAHAGLVRSSRGRSGGIILMNKPSDVSLLDIITAIQEGSTICAYAGVSDKNNSDPICSIYPVWAELRKDVERRLREQSLDRLAAVLESARTGSHPAEVKQ